MARRWRAKMDRMRRVWIRLACVLVALVGATGLAVIADATDATAQLDLPGLSTSCDLDAGGCDATDWGIGFDCAVDAATCSSGVFDECSTSSDCSFSFDVDCSAGPCDYSISTVDCETSGCSYAASDTCEGDGCIASLVDDCAANPCDVGVGFDCTADACTLDTRPDCTDCVFGFGPVDLAGAGTYYVVVDGSSSPATSDDYSLTVGSVGLGSVAEDILAGELPIGDGIKYADDTDPATNPVNRTDVRPAGVSYFNFTTCEGDGCPPLPPCGGNIICGSEGPQPGTDYTAAAIRFDELPDLTTVFSQIALIAAASGAPTHTPIPQFPGDTYGGSSHQVALEGDANTLMLSGQQTATNFSPGTVAGFVVIGDKTIVIVVRPEFFGNPLSGLGIGIHIHDGAFGATAGSSSAVFTQPQWPTGGPRTALPALSIPTHLFPTRNSSLAGGQVLHDGTVIPPDPDPDDGVDPEPIPADEAAGTVDVDDSTAADGGGRGSLTIVLLVFGFALLVGVVVYLWRQRQQPVDNRIGVVPAGERSNLSPPLLLSRSSSSYSSSSSSSASSSSSSYSSTSSYSSSSSSSSSSIYSSSSSSYASSLSSSIYSSSSSSIYRSSSSSSYSSRPRGGLADAARILLDESPPTDRGDGPLARVRLAFERRRAPRRDRSGSPLTPSPLRIRDGRLFRDGSAIDGDVIFVLDRRGRFIVAPSREHGVKRPYHTDLLPTGKAYGAGEFRVDNGRLVRVSDMSGHFKPGAAQILAVLDRLIDEGVPLDGVDAKFGRRSKRDLRDVSAVFPARRIIDDRAAVEASLAEARRYLRHRPWVWDRDRDHQLRRILDTPLTQRWGLASP